MGIKEVVKGIGRSALPGIFPEEAPAGTEYLDRELTAEEHNFLHHLLTHGSAKALEFLPQLNHTRVRGRCLCGCPTIDLRVSEEVAPVNTAEQIIVDIYGDTPEGESVGIMILTRQGKLSCLDVYSLAGSDNPFGLPTISSLRDNYNN